MSTFKKAHPKQAYIKMGIYGASGSGKTFTSLLLAEGLAKLSNKRIAFVDTERGTDFYCQTVATRKIHPEGFDFDAIYTKSIVEVITALKSIDINEYGIIVLDSITHLWEAAKLAYAGKETSIGTIPFTAWAKIKKPYKELINIIMNLDAHVFICGRQGNEFDETEDGKLTKVGTKMKAEGETPYEPHILLHMETIKDAIGNNVITAIAEKDRTGVLGTDLIYNPSFEKIIKPIIGLLGTEQAKIESDEETAKNDAENIQDADIIKTKNSEELLKEFSAKISLCKTEEEFKVINKAISDSKKLMTKNDISQLRELYLAKQTTLK